MFGGAGSAVRPQPAGCERGGDRSALIARCRQSFAPRSSRRVDRNRVGFPRCLPRGPTTSGHGGAHRSRRRASPPFATTSNSIECRRRATARRWGRRCVYPGVPPSRLNLTGDYSPSYFYQLVPHRRAARTLEKPSRRHRITGWTSSSPSPTPPGRPWRPGPAAVTASASSPSAARPISGASRTPRPDLDMLTGRANWSHGVGRTGVLLGRVRIPGGEFGYGGRATEQRLRIGADYSPALSASRRIMFRFSLAPSALRDSRVRGERDCHGNALPAGRGRSGGVPLPAQLVLRRQLSSRGRVHCRAARRRFSGTSARLELSGLAAGAWMCPPPPDT